MTDLKSFFNSLSPLSEKSWNRFSALFSPRIMKNR